MLTSAAGVSRVPYIGWKGDFSKLDVIDQIAVFSSDADSCASLDPIFPAASH